MSPSLDRLCVAIVCATTILACDSGSADAKTDAAKADAAEVKPAAKPEPEPKPEAKPEPPAEPPPAFMAEAERVGPKGDVFADHERREVDVAGLARRGPESAPVTVLQCVDLRDAYCLRGQRNMAQVREAIPDQAAFYLRPYWNVLDSTEAAAAKKFKPAIEQIKQTKLIARALVAAERQGKLWELHDAMLASERDQFTPSGFETMAGSVDGLDVEMWKTQLDDPETQAAVDAHREACAALGVGVGVPAYFVNGRMIAGALPAEAMRYVIEVEANGGFEKLPSP